MGRQISGASYFTILPESYETWKSFEVHDRKKYLDFLEETIVKNANIKVAYSLEGKCELLLTT